MVYKKEHGWVPVITGTRFENHLVNCVTGDGVLIDETYSLNYKFEHKLYVKNLLTVNGMELINRTRDVLRLFKDEEDLGIIKNICSEFMVLYSTGLMDKKRFNSIKRGSQKEIVKVVERSLKGKKQDLYSINCYLCCYLYIQLKNREESESGHKELIVVDVIDQPNKIFSQDLKETWEEQPITQRYGIKTFEDFIEFFKKGFLKLEWNT